MIVSLGLGDKIIFEFGSKGKQRVKNLFMVLGRKRIYILAQWVSPWDIGVLQEVGGDTDSFLFKAFNYWFYSFFSPCFRSCRASWGGSVCLNLDGFGSSRIGRKSVNFLPTRELRSVLQPHTKVLVN